MIDDPPADAEPGAANRTPEAPISPPPQTWGAWASLGLAVALMVLYTLMQGMVISVLMAGRTLLSGGVSHPGTAAPLGLWLSVSLLIAAPLVCGLVAGLARIRGPVVGYLGLTWPRWKPAVAWAASITLFLWLYDVVGTWLDRPPAPEFMFDVFRTAGSLPLLYLALAGMAPLVEELLFRGFLIPGLAASRLGVPGAVAVSSALWAGMHAFQYDLYDLTGIFLLGLAFGAMRLATGSTLLPIAIHAGVNAVAILQVGWLLQG